MSDIFDLEKVYDDLEKELGPLVQGFVKRRKEKYEEAVKKLLTGLKQDALRYGKMFKQKLLTESDLKLLVAGRWSQLKIEVLAEMSLSKNKFELLAADVLSLVLRVLGGK